MRLAGRLGRLEARRRVASYTCPIVVYNPETGQPLPGFEPRPGVVVHVWIPDNGRGADESHIEPMQPGSGSSCD